MTRHYTRHYRKEKTPPKIKALSLISFTLSTATTCYIFAKWISNDETNPLILLTYALCFFAFLLITVYEWMNLNDDREI